jgi:hypothetical protein
MVAGGTQLAAAWLTCTGSSSASTIRCWWITRTGTRSIAGGKTCGASHSQNTCNHAKKRYAGGTSSNFKDVNWHAGRCRAQIAKHGVRHHLGLFDSEQDAALAYDAARAEAERLVRAREFPTGRRKYRDSRPARPCGHERHTGEPLSCGGLSHQGRGDGVVTAVMSAPTNQPGGAPGTRESSPCA